MFLLGLWVSCEVLILSMMWGFFYTCTWVVDALFSVVFLVVVMVGIVLPVAVNIFTLCPVDGPFRVLAPDQGLPKVLYFLLKKLLSGVNCFVPMGKCTYDTILSR